METYKKLLDDYVNAVATEKEETALLRKKTQETQKPFLDRLREIMVIIDKFFPKKPKCGNHGIGDSYFDLQELEIHNIYGRWISIDENGVSISWSGYNHYSMFIPIKYLSMLDEEILKELQNESIEVFNFSYELT